MVAGMCGRFAGNEDVKMVKFRFDVSASDAETEAWRPTWNAAPTQRLPVVMAEAAGRRLVLMRWGWPITWDQGKDHVNAIGETAADKRPFAEAFRARRCIVPASAFYEWRPATRRGAKPEPYAFTVTGGLFGIAALWQPVAAGSPGPGAFILLTTEANAVVAGVHHRMAAILPRSAESRWLDLDTPLAALRALMTPLPAELMQARRVSPRVNSVRNDGPDLLDTAPEPPREPTIFD
jgi:putative SOS response-associated peptidase YedK